MNKQRNKLQITTEHWVVIIQSCTFVKANASKEFYLMELHRKFFGGTADNTTGERHCGNIWLYTALDSNLNFIYVQKLADNY